MKRSHCIYIAAKFEDQDFLRAVRDELSALGIVCTSRWLEERQNFAYGQGMPVRRIAERDLEDIDAADMLVVFSHPIGPDSGTVGRHVETGYAIAKEKPIIFLGHPPHTFYDLPFMRVGSSITAINTPHVTALVIANHVYTVLGEA